jgi:hypothetical protein
MAHFAQLDENNIVVQVIVVNDDVIQNLSFPESEPIGVFFCQSLFGADTRWVQTSYNNSFRCMYAGIGNTYRTDLDAFIRPQPFPSWLLNEKTGEWFDPDTVPGGAIYETVQSAILPSDEDILAQMQASKGE